MHQRRTIFHQEADKMEKVFISIFQNSKLSYWYGTYTCPNLDQHFLICC